MPRATARGITRVTITTTTTTPEVLSESAASHAGSRFDWSWVVIGGCVAFTVYVAMVPLGFLFWQSFRTPQTATTPAVWTLANYLAAYGTSETFRLFWTSIRFASGASLFAFLVGTALAWMNERTNTPFKTVFFALSLIPLVIPSILFTVAWILLASPQIGIVNQLLQGWLGLQQPPFDIYSMAGMIWVDGLHYSPMAFLLMSAAFRAMDPSLEESATMSGASVWQVLWRVTLKLTWPAIFATILILFVRSIESFEVPALLGLPVGIEVFTSSIYTAVHRYPSQVGLASAYGVALLAITTVGVYAVSRLSSKGSKYATMTGKGFRPRQIDLGVWRWLTASLFAVYFSLIVLLPFLVLLWSSFQRFYTVPSREALRNLTLDPYRFVFSYPDLASTVWNSLLLSFGAATVVMLVTSVICWLVVKTKLPGRWLLDNIASLPLVFPGIVLGLSIMIFYLNVDIGIYGTIWIMFVAYITRFMPYGLRYNTTSMVQIHKELEESAAMCGASWSTTFRRIVLPLLKPGLVAGWIYVMIVSIRELSTSILLYSPDTRVVSIVIWELWENGQYVELSALGVLFILSLFVLVMLARWAGSRYGIRE
jgi:iron(III) transport system permease protein